MAVDWLYVPLSKLDTLMLLGVRKPTWPIRTKRGTTWLVSLSVFASRLRLASDTHFQIRTELGGDQVIGCRLDRGHSRESILAVEPDSTLVYNASEFRGVTAVTDIAASPGQCVNIPFWTPGPSTFMPHTLGYYSTASLENLISITVFRFTRNNFCRGMIFEYGNGAKQAVGQCRVGVDPARTYQRPAKLCIHSITELQLSLKAIESHTMVDITGQDHDCGHIGRWECYKIGGRLEMWFNRRESDIRLLGATTMSEASLSS